MPFASFVPLLSPTIAFAGFMLVILQLRRGTRADVSALPPTK